MLSIWKSCALYPNICFLCFLFATNCFRWLGGVAIVHIYSGRQLLVFVAPVSKIFVLAQEKKPLMGTPNWELLVLVVLQLLLALVCLFVGHPSTFYHCMTVTIGGPGTGWRSRVFFCPSCLLRLYLHLIVVLKIHQARTASSLYLWPPPFIFSLYVFCRFL